MPKIEIHGFSHDPAMLVQEKIDKAMQKIGLGDDAITNIYFTHPTSCDGKYRFMPYLMICSTDTVQIEKIVRVLKEEKIGLDVETLTLDNFIPADKMK